MCAAKPEVAFFTHCHGDREGTLARSVLHFTMAKSPTYQAPLPAREPRGAGQYDESVFQRRCLRGSIRFRLLDSKLSSGLSGLLNGWVNG